jgi:transcriptional regulator with XRE-family HTH domain
MKERLLEFLRSENKSSAQFAEEIGVQPSGISHILSGRNKPSLDFILKMLEKYQYLSTDWLLFGRGLMHKDGKMPTLFDEISVEPGATKPILTGKNSEEKPKEIVAEENDLSGKLSGNQANISKSEIYRIVLFYRDNSFEDYSPRK